MEKAMKLLSENAGQEKLSELLEGRIVSPVFRSL